MWGLKINIYLGISPELLNSLGSVHPVIPFATVGTRMTMGMTSHLGYFVPPPRNIPRIVTSLCSLYDELLTSFNKEDLASHGFTPKAHGMEKTRLVNQDLISMPWLSVRNDHRSQWNVAGLKNLTEKKLYGGSYHVRKTALKILLFFCCSNTMCSFMTDLRSEHKGSPLCLSRITPSVHSVPRKIFFFTFLG